MSSELPATRTSLLKAIEQDAREHSLISLGVFYERYRQGLASFLTHRYGIDAQDANDILHDFLYEKMTDASLIRSYLECLAQSKSGHRSFRPYLVRSLSNFTIDRLRSRKSYAALDESPEESVLGSEYADLYTLEWVQGILATTLQRLRRHYLDRDNQSHWVLFVARWMEPLVIGTPPPSYEALACEFNFTSAKQVGNVLTNVLRTFKQKWRDVLEEDLGSDDSQALAEALCDARESLRMAKYIDFSRLLTEAMQRGSTTPKTLEIGAYSIDEQSYAGLLDLATDGFDQLLPIEQTLLFESHLRTPIDTFLDIDCSLEPLRSCQDQSLKSVLINPTPNAECTRLLAKALQRLVRHENATIPACVAGVIRFALIALADIRCDQTITRVSRSEMLMAMSDVVELVWLDETCRSLIQEYLGRHGSPSRQP